MIWNFLKTTILFALLTGILLAASYAIGISPFLAVGLAAFLNLGLYWFSDKMVLAMTRAKKVSEVEFPELHTTIKRLASNVISLEDLKSTIEKQGFSCIQRH